MKLLLANIFLCFIYVGFAQPAGYSFGKQVIVDASQVSGTAALPNFPVLISITDPDLRTTVNGGSVENPNGFDIIFTLGDCATALSHDLEYYNPVNGELVVWVQVPLLDNALNTPFFMFYGNTSVAADQSSSNIWTDAGYDGVWHLHNDFADASGSGNNGINNGSTNISPAYNSADGQSFVDPNHWIELPSHSARTGDFSYTGWIRTTDNTIAGQRVICDDATNGNGCHAISVGDPGAGRIRFYIRGMGPVSLDSPGGTIINNTWHYIAATFDDNTNLKSLYVDGALVNSTTVGGTLGAAAGNASIGGEVAAGESGNRFQGDLDEIRANNALLSADWILTEYNNQNSPSTFCSFSTQLDANTLCVTLPVELVNFKVTAINSSKVKLEWQTASERNNEYFTIERSKDGIDWEEIEQIDGAGQSSTFLNYSTFDYKPYVGISYYRLKQTDYNGDYSYSEIRSVDISKTENGIVIYPNPTHSIFTVKGSESELSMIRIKNVLGQDVTGSLIITELSDTKYMVDVSQLSDGIYSLFTRNAVIKVNKQ